jgi:hypothetical protein
MLVCALALAAAIPSTAQARPAALADPPATWQEHWFEHNQLLQRVAFNDTVALYFGNDVDKSAQDWLMPYLTGLWQYAQRTYGNSGNKMTADRLYPIHHEGKYSGGHPSTIYDASHDFRNVSDVGGSNWTTPQYEVATHETGHIVESIAAGKHGSPAFGLWGDHGHAQVTVRFFGLLGQYFPNNGTDFTRDLNWGEFVHFMSGAAGVNLKSMATTAFGRPADRDAQFTQARADFPGITYSRANGQPTGAPIS